MSEVKRGTLCLDVSGKRRITFVTRAGGKRQEGLTAFAQVSDDVRRRIEQGNEVEVDFERVDNRIDRIRAAGQPWRPPTTSASPSARNDRQAAQSRFHNPYNFVPSDDAPAPNGGLGQFHPPGHHAYKGELFEGRITVELTATSPLLLLDPASTKVKNDHTTVDLLTDSCGRPILRPTSLKGALRSAYEAITGSRLGVFHGHDRPLARRMDARDSLAMMPARISDCGKKLELYLGTHTCYPEWKRNEHSNGWRWQVPKNEMYAAWLPRYCSGHRNQNGPVISKSAVRYPGGDLPRHGDRVVCWLNLVNHSNPSFKYWRVVWLQPSGCTRPVPCEDAIRKLDMKWSRKNHNKQKTYQLAEGYVCVTNQNIKKKHDERVFFVPKNNVNTFGGNPPTASTTVEICKKWRTNWNHLVEDYQSTHESDLDTRKRNEQAPDAFLGPNPGKTAWSRHVYESSAATLKAKDLCYARVDKSGAIVDLYPVMISRELARTIPRDLLPSHLRPAQKIDELSAADRVFGWVRQGKDDAQSAGAQNAYKGHLRVRKITCETDAKQAVHRFNGAGLPLAILSTPKPQQALFYAAGARTYDEAEKLSGRKFYPHHRGVPESYWKPEGAMKEAEDGPGKPEELDNGFFREYVRRKGAGENAKQRDSQNRSVKAWVNPATKLTAELRFDNLNAAELGALLWLCNLGEGRHLRVGAGKPLGFGSLSPKIACIEIRGHAAKQVEYRTLVPTSIEEQKPAHSAEGTVPTGSGAGSASTDGQLITCPEHALKQFVPAFSKALGKECNKLESHPAIKAFLWMAAGPADGAPVHYPRVRQDEGAGPVPPDPKGENYRWFVENQRQKAPGPLPAAGSSGLPYHKPKPKRSKQGPKPNYRSGNPRRG